MNRLLKIAIMVATCLGVGYISGEVTRASVETWYTTIEKPSFNPPNWLFAPVWSLLYFFMGVAAGLVWTRIEMERETVRQALKFFFIQLALNALWSFLFFWLKNPLLAMIEIVLLWLMIYETWHKFRPINKFAGWLFVPYMLWVAFAAVLNASIWYLNR